MASVTRIVLVIREPDQSDQILLQVDVTSLSHGKTTCNLRHTGYNIHNYIFLYIILILSESIQLSDMNNVMH